jgi:hypothetical protein
MAQTYYPPQRDILAWALTDAGWAQGKFIIPRHHGFIEHLDASTGLLKMKDVQLPGYAAPMSFFGVFRDVISLIVPDPGSATPQTPVANAIVHNVTCLLRQGVLTGALQLRQGIRLSDHLQRYTGFLPMEGCTFHAADGNPLVQGDMPLVYVNVKQLVGVTET